MSRKKPTYAQLQRQVTELEASLAIRHATAASKIVKASTGNRMGSGVLLELTAVGGAEIVPPVMIRDGLSDETIAAIKVDIERSLALIKSGV